MSHEGRFDGLLMAFWRPSYGSPGRNFRLPRDGLAAVESGWPPGIGRDPRMKGVKDAGVAVWGPSTERAGAVRRGLLYRSARFTARFRASSSFRELAMADVAFVVTTIAVFALVAFIAKGVAKL
ncbi:hypothetical protein AB0G73_30715 [Streptomyces sp. NPDC020719]